MVVTALEEGAPLPNGACLRCGALVNDAFNGRRRKELEPPMELGGEAVRRRITAAEPSSCLFQRSSNAAPADALQHEVLAGGQFGEFLEPHGRQR